MLFDYILVKWLADTTQDLNVERFVDKLELAQCCETRSVFEDKNVEKTQFNSIACT